MSLTQAQAQSCVDLFNEPIISEPDRSLLPPLFKDVHEDLQLAFEIGSLMYRSPQWRNQMLGGLNVLRIKDFKYDGGAYVLVEFKLEGEQLSQSGTVYFQMLPKESLQFKDLNEFEDIRVFRVLPETLNMSTFVAKNRELDKDLVSIASDIYEYLPQRSLDQLGSSKLKLKVQLNAQRHGLFLKDSVFMVEGEINPALWTIIEYFKTLELKLGMMDIRAD